MSHHINPPLRTSNKDGLYLYRSLLHLSGGGYSKLYLDRSVRPADPHHPAPIWARGSDLVPKRYSLSLIGVCNFELPFSHVLTIDRYLFYSTYLSLYL